MPIPRIVAPCGSSTSKRATKIISRCATARPTSRSPRSLGTTPMRCHFPFCVSAQTDKSHGAKFIDNVTVVRGNIVLADHGATIGGEALGSAGAGVAGGCRRAPAASAALRRIAEPMAPRFRPTIAQSAADLCRAASTRAAPAALPGAAVWSAAMARCRSADQA